MADDITKLPENARYLAVVKPDETDLRIFFDQIKQQMKEHPDRPVVAIIYRSRE